MSINIRDFDLYKWLVDFSEESIRSMNGHSISIQKRVGELITGRICYFCWFENFPNWHECKKCWDANSYHYKKPSDTAHASPIIADTQG